MIYIINCDTPAITETHDDPPPKFIYSTGWNLCQYHLVDIFSQEQFYLSNQCFLKPARKGITALTYIFRESTIYFYEGGSREIKSYNFVTKEEKTVFRELDDVTGM